MERLIILLSMAVFSDWFAGGTMALTTVVSRPPLNQSAPDVIECNAGAATLKNNASRLTRKQLNDLQRNQTDCAWNYIRGRLGGAKAAQPQKDKQPQPLQPPIGEDGYVHVNITDVKLLRAYIWLGPTSSAGTAAKFTGINGALKLKIVWEDPRVAWTPQPFMANLTLYNKTGMFDRSDVWFPSIGYPKPEKPKEWYTYDGETTIIYPNGTIEMTTDDLFLANLGKECDYMLDAYPNDKMTCRGILAMNAYSSLVKLQFPSTEPPSNATSGKGGGKEEKEKKPVEPKSGSLAKCPTCPWKIKPFTYAVDENTRYGDGIRLEVTVSRDEPFLKAQLRLPSSMTFVLTCAALLMPFEGRKLKHFVTLFVLLLQFLSFRLLCTRAAKSYSSTRVPHGTNPYFLFYEFSIGITLASHLIAAALQLVWKLIPTWNVTALEKPKRLMAKMLAMVCCLERKAANENDIINNNIVFEPTGLNTLLLATLNLVFITAYVIGCIVIMA